MVARVMQSAVLIVLTALTLTGCGRQVSKESSPNFDLLATGPDRKALPTPHPFVSAALDATGGLAAWEQSKRIEFRATVTACEREGCFYLTEHDFVLCPWSDAIQVTAHEPRADFTWQVVRGQYYYARQADPNLDVSPLRGLCRDYADAVLQIATAPVRMLEGNAMLTSRPAAVQIAGQWYLPIDADHQASGGSLKAEGLGDGGIVGARSHPQAALEAATQSHWTQGIYFQGQDRSLVDMIWLGNPVAQQFLVVRGYDYVKNADTGVKIPTKIEVFQSDPDANIGPRLALIDLKR
jgi:hypothetical protein